MLFLGSTEQLLGKDRYLYVTQAAEAGPARRRIATSAAHKHLPCLQGGIKPRPWNAATAELSQTPAVFHISRPPQ